MGLKDYQVGFEAVLNGGTRPADMVVPLLNLGLDVISHDYDPGNGLYKANLRVKGPNNGRVPSAEKIESQMEKYPMVERAKVSLK